MCRVALYLLLAVSALHAASTLPGPAPVTVLLDFEQPHSSVSLNTLQSELDRILTPARVSIDLRVKSEVPSSAQFGELVIFKMKGHCSMKGLPIGALSDERGPLAMTYSVDGQMLSFGEVECDHVRESLQRAIGKGNPDQHQRAYSIALARVIAHEMYHMMSSNEAHTKEGATKKSLSAEELSQPRLALNDAAAAAIRTGGAPAGHRQETSSKP